MKRSPPKIATGSRSTSCAYACSRGGSDGRGLLLSRRVAYPAQLGEVSQAQKYVYLVGQWLGRDPQPQYEVRLRVPQPPAFLRPDMTASVEMLAARKDSALILPAEFVRDPDGRPWVLAVRDGRARRVPVVLGVRGLGEVEVAEGLAEGERAIVATSPVAEGARVRVRDWRAPKARAGADVPAMTGR